MRIINYIYILIIIIIYIYIYIILLPEDPWGPPKGLFHHRWFLQVDRYTACIHHVDVGLSCTNMYYTTTILHTCVRWCVLYTHTCNCRSLGPTSFFFNCRFLGPIFFFIVDPWGQLLFARESVCMHVHTVCMHVQTPT
jgi:hypothetical protein